MENMQREKDLHKNTSALCSMVAAASSCENAALVQAERGKLVRVDRKMKGAENRTILEENLFEPKCRKLFLLLFLFCVTL